MFDDDLVYLHSINQYFERVFKIQCLIIVRKI